MNNRLGFSSFILALGLYSLRVEKKGFLSLLWTESLTQEMQISSVFNLLIRHDILFWISGEIGMVAVQADHSSH